MTAEEYRRMMEYTEVTDINVAHGVSLVKHLPSGQVFVRKVLSTYSLPVYRQLYLHPVDGIPGIHDFFENEHRLIVFEEYVPGETLEDQLRNQGSFPPGEVRQIALALCDILIALEAFSPPIIHRDIKPSNIIRSISGTLTLLDLNAAKYENARQSADTQLLGTQGYAAPEQYGFGPSLIQTDIYAVGMVMNALLNGEPSRTVDPDSPLAAVIIRCLMLEPAARYASASELKAALLAVHILVDSTAAFGLPSRKFSMKSALSASEHSPSVPSASAHSDLVHENLTNPLPGSWRRFLPPGFRSGTIRHMIPAAIVYLLIGLLTASFSEADVTSPSYLWPTRLTFLLVCAAIILCSADYCGIQQVFPLCRHPKRWVRILGILLLDVIAAFAAFALCVTVTAFLV